MGLTTELRCFCFIEHFVVGDETDPTRTGIAQHIQESFDKTYLDLDWQLRAGSDESGSSWANYSNAGYFAHLPND